MRFDTIRDVSGGSSPAGTAGRETDQTASNARIRQLEHVGVGRDPDRVAVGARHHDSAESRTIIGPKTGPTRRSGG